MSDETSRILIVEDEEKLAKFVQLELGYEGYEVIVYSPLKTALKIASPD